MAGPKNIFIETSDNKTCMQTPTRLVHVDSTKGTTKYETTCDVNRSHNKVKLNLSRNQYPTAATKNMMYVM